MHASTAAEQCQGRRRHHLSPSLSLSLAIRLRPHAPSSPSSRCLPGVMAGLSWLLVAATSTFPVALLKISHAHPLPKTVCEGVAGDWGTETRGVCRKQEARGPTGTEEAEVCHRKGMRGGVAVQLRR